MSALSLNKRLCLLVLLFLFGMFFSINRVHGMESQVGPKSNNASVGESCLATRQERQSLCNRAAKYCTEVEELTAFNEIRSCAHFSQRCAIMGQEEEKYCFGDPESRVSLSPHLIKPSGHN